ncbi:MAG: zinc ribbon domain-containing protein [Chitinophagaceae bacterium]|nr:zinc ribbon domain-containing protein [Oligoflexus sp.]
MPIYEFRCKDCGQVSEFQMKMSDPNPTTCPTCGHLGALSKIMSLPSFQLKGGGWYSDAYDGKSNKPGTPSAPSSEPGAAPAPSAAPAAPAAASPTPAAAPSTATSSPSLPSTPSSGSKS